MASQERKYRDRRTKMAEFLRSLPRKRFDLSSWVNNSFAKDPEKTIEEQLKEPSCGTTACVAGWMPVVFPRLAMFLGGYGSVIPICRNKPALQGSIAFSQLLGMTQKEADTICFPDQNPHGYSATPKQCAKLIEELNETD